MADAVEKAIFPFDKHDYNEPVKIDGKWWRVGGVVFDKATNPYFQTRELIPVQTDERRLLEFESAQKDEESAFLKRQAQEKTAFYHTMREKQRVFLKNNPEIAVYMALNGRILHK